MITLCYADKYVLSTPTNICIYLLFVLQSSMKKSHNYFHINAKLKHKDLFKLWTQGRGEQYSDILGENVPNSVTGTYRYFCC